MKKRHCRQPGVPANVKFAKMRPNNQMAESESECQTFRECVHHVPPHLVQRLLVLWWYSRSALPAYIPVYHVVNVTTASHFDSTRSSWQSDSDFAMSRLFGHDLEYRFELQV
jgi:hypothetical protein